MSELISLAEQRADESRALSNFKNLSLPGIKDEVAQILSLIGRGRFFCKGVGFRLFPLHQFSSPNNLLSRHVRHATNYSNFGSYGRLRNTSVRGLCFPTRRFPS